ncbi:sensor histidine kinase [Ktedonobacter racemifer]|uniref:Integral membrane sensor signal transduction histidine kinase n=1 Tax=Ktedonobacter racemifer DSM 44963 TaxID=485913 RepID=D6TYK3_KTERA|nr:sensor histidine kinase [Ktedonobacter racemifer]EFH85078.1 integral membrane sensor signal transduction histidine kinase [Ktedonobacter racemifer DSM 44963]
MKKKSLIQSPLRWFLLLWIGMTVAAWLVGRDIQNAVSGSEQVAVKPPPPLPLTLLSLLLMALYSFLLWRGLSDRVQPRFFWLYFLVQGLLVFAMSLVAGQPNLALNFYLALTLCALAMSKRVGPMLLIATGSLLLFAVALSVGIPLGGSSGKDLVAAHARIPLDVSFGNNLAAAALWFNVWSLSDGMTIVFFVLGYLVLYWQQSHSQTQLERAHRELQAAHRELAASSRQIETLTLLAERQRMARELHDTLLQGMAGIIMQLKVMSAQMDRQHYRQAQQALSQTLSSAGTALVEARHAIRDLRAKTPRIEQFVASVQEEIAHFSQLTGIECHTELDDLGHTPPQHCEHVLRVMGEALSNVARHARARHVSVEARVMEKWLSITVQDDGQGFDPASSELHTGHYGLLGLQERAQLVGGSLSLSSAKGAGTTLRFRVPLAPSDHPALLREREGSPALGGEEQTYD